MCRRCGSLLAADSSVLRWNSGERREESSSCASRAAEMAPGVFSFPRRGYGCWRGRVFWVGWVKRAEKSSSARTRGVVENWRRGFVNKLWRHERQMKVADGFKVAIVVVLELMDEW